MISKPALLAVGFSTWGTGYNRVLTTLFKYWAFHYDIHFVGCGYPPRDVDLGWKYYPAAVGNGDPLGVSQCEKIIQEVKPKIVFLLNDISRIIPHIKRLALYKPEIKLLAYFPMEGELKRTELIEPLQFLDRIISYTYFGKDELLKAEKKIQEVNPGFYLPPIEVLPHGVDTSVFKPVSGDHPEVKKVPESLQDQLQIGHDSFLVLNANQFQDRKQIRTTLEGFCLFSQDKNENVRLILHHTLLGPYGYGRVHKLIQQVDDYYNRKGMLKKRVLISPQEGTNVLEETDLVELYQLCEVGVNTSGGEGWGLVSFEHAATGAAQIVPRHSSCSELWDGAALFLDRQQILETPDEFPMQFYKLSPNQLAEQLEKLYQDREMLSRISDQCLKNALSKEYRWQIIADKWEYLFEAVLKEGNTNTPLPIHFNFRENTIDSSVYRIAVSCNEYRLPENFSMNDVVIDIGAHIGCFAFMALSRGAKVYAFEADLDNYNLARRHLDLYIKQGRLILTHAAMWSSTKSNEKMFISSYPDNGWNTGGATILGQDSGNEVNTVGFDQFINKITQEETKTIRMLKLDCEGSEWPILLRSEKLDFIDEICGEFHEYGGAYDTLRVPPNISDVSDLTADALKSFLEAKGFETEFSRKIYSGKPDRAGLFFARKKVLSSCNFIR